MKILRSLSFHSGLLDQVFWSMNCISWDLD